MLDPAGAVRAMRRARRAEREYGIPREAIARCASGSEEASAYLEWSRAFERHAGELDCIDAGQLLARLATEKDAATLRSEPLAWIENPAWRPAARRWLEQHARQLAPPQLAAREAGSVRMPSQASEWASIAAWAAHGLEANPDFRAWICVPGFEPHRAQLVYALDAALAPQRYLLCEPPGAAPYAVAGGTPLADYAPVRAALDVLDATFGRLSFERFSALLRAPQMQASPADASAAAVLDLELRRRAPDEADLAGWLALAERTAAARSGNAVPALQRLRAVERGFEGAREHRAISRWIPLWMQALDAGPWAGRARWSSVEFQAGERFRELLAELAVADAIFGAHSRGSAQGILRRAASDTVFQPQTGTPQIAVSGQLIDPWLPYDGLWVAGCSEDRWPPRIDPIPLLPVSVQREHGVIPASAEAQLELALNLQSRWMSRARECRFSHADPGDGRPSAASPLVPAAAAVTPADPQPHWRRMLAAAPLLERLIDERAPPFDAGEPTRGIATLKAQSRCAFRGFAETRLRCDRLERPVPGFNERERGELVHLALEHIWSSLRDWHALQAITAGDQAALIEAGSAGAIASVARGRDPGPRWKARERARLAQVLSRWLDVERQRQPFRVESIEQRVQVARFADLALEVRIDRMDRLADGARVLIDYKTGGARADWRGERPDNPQLPMYALLHPDALVAVAYARVNAADLGFVPETEREALFPGKRRTRLEGLPDFAALIAVWEARIEKLAQEFVAGRAEVAPTLQACRSCTLQALCRVPAALEESRDE